MIIEGGGSPSPGKSSSSSRTQHAGPSTPTLVEATPRSAYRGRTGIVEPSDGHDGEGDMDTTELEPPVRVTQYLRGTGYELTDCAVHRCGRRHRRTCRRHAPDVLGGRAFTAMRGIVERDLRARSQRLRALEREAPRASAWR